MSMSVISKVPATSEPQPDPMELFVSGFFHFTSLEPFQGTLRAAIEILPKEDDGGVLNLSLDLTSNFKPLQDGEVVDIEGGVDFEENGHMVIHGDETSFIRLPGLLHKSEKPLPISFSLIGVVKNIEFPKPGFFEVYIFLGRSQKRAAALLETRHHPILPEIDSLVKIDDLEYSWIDPRGCYHFDTQVEANVLEASTTLAYNESTHPASVFTRTQPQAEAVAIRRATIDVAGPSSFPPPSHPSHQTSSASGTQAIPPVATHGGGSSSAAPQAVPPMGNSAVSALGLSMFGESSARNTSAGSRN